MLVFFINLIIRVSAFPDYVNGLAVGTVGNPRDCLSKSILANQRPDPECDSSGRVSRSPTDVAGYPLSTLILAVPRVVRIQSGHDGQVQTIFEIDKMAVSALTLDASEN